MNKLYEDGFQAEAVDVAVVLSSEERLTRLQASVEEVTQELFEVVAVREAFGLQDECNDPSLCGGAIKHVTAGQLRRLHAKLNMALLAARQL